MTEPIRTPEQLKAVLETVLLASTVPLPITQLRKSVGEEFDSDTLRRTLDELRNDWKGRGVELTQVAEGWRFQTRTEFQPWLDRIHPEKPPKYSRAVLETLAIIAYRQPVSRGDIEAIRGVAVSSQILRTLEERGWIEAVGHREVPGRPAIYATTKTFLGDLGLRALEELPSLPEPGQASDELIQILDPTPASAPQNAG